MSALPRAGIFLLSTALEITPDQLCTCPIRRAADEGGQHLHFGSLVTLLLQARFHLRPHPLLHLQQLLVGELELSQRLVDQPVLL